MWLVAANRPLQGATIDLVRKDLVYPMVKLHTGAYCTPLPPCPGVVSKLPLRVITEIQHTMCKGGQDKGNSKS